MATSVVTKLKLNPSAFRNARIGKAYVRTLMFDFKIGRVVMAGGGARAVSGPQVAATRAPLRAAPKHRPHERTNPIHDHCDIRKINTHTKKNYNQSSFKSGESNFKVPNTCL